MGGRKVAGSRKTDLRGQPLAPRPLLLPLSLPSYHHAAGRLQMPKREWVWDHSSFAVGLSSASGSGLKVDRNREKDNKQAVCFVPPPVLANDYLTKGLFYPLLPAYIPSPPSFFFFCILKSDWQFMVGQLRGGLQSVSFAVSPIEISSPPLPKLLNYSWDKRRHNMNTKAISTRSRIVGNKKRFNVGASILSPPH